MKKSIFLLLLLLGLTSVHGQDRTTEIEGSSFVAKIPAGIGWGCEDPFWIYNFKAGGDFSFLMVMKCKDGFKEMNNSGKWEISNAKLKLQDQRGELIFFKIEGDKLLPLNEKGEQLEEDMASRFIFERATKM